MNKNSHIGSVPLTKTNKCWRVHNKNTFKSKEQFEIGCLAFQGKSVAKLAKEKEVSHSMEYNEIEAEIGIALEERYSEIWGLFEEIKEKAVKARA